MGLVFPMLFFGSLVVAGIQRRLTLWPSNPWSGTLQVSLPGDAPIGAVEFVFFGSSECGDRPLGAVRAGCL